jgi:hypothetical protein
MEVEDMSIQEVHLVGVEELVHYQEGVEGPDHYQVVAGESIPHLEEVEQSMHPLMTRTGALQVDLTEPFSHSVQHLQHSKHLQK